MKKIFVLMLVLFVAFSMFAVDEGVAGASKYKVSFGNGLRYENKGGYDQVDNTFKFQVVLPVSKVIQVGVEGSFNDVLDAVTTTDLNSWSAINNYGKVAVGIVPNEKLKVGFYVMGGSEGVAYKEQHLTDGNLPAKSMIGNGFFEFSAKLTLQSALFNNKISSLSIKQGANIGFLGHGASAANKILADAVNDADKQWSGSAAGVSNFSDWKYFGEVAVEVPIHTLAGWTNISNFTYGATLAYDVSGVSYSVATEGGNDLYAELPSKIAGGASLENWLKIAPDSSTEFKLTVKPGFSLYQTTWTDKGTNVPQTSKTGTEIYTEFGLWGKKSIEVANIMGIVPYFELDAKWKLSYNNTVIANAITPQNIGYGHLASMNSFNTGDFTVDPGVKLGLKFGNWETAIRWNPSATFGIGNGQDGINTALTEDATAKGQYSSHVLTQSAAASASNIWNLANWDFSIACEFPPPTK